VQGASVKCLDLSAALQDTKLTPMDELVLIALYRVMPHVSAEHFMDCSERYHLIMHDLPAALSL